MDKGAARNKRRGTGVEGAVNLLREVGEAVDENFPHYGNAAYIEEYGIKYNCTSRKSRDLEENMIHVKIGAAEIRSKNTIH